MKDILGIITLIGVPLNLWVIIYGFQLGNVNVVTAGFIALTVSIIALLIRANL